jgi:REP element-mobilizing transposase RayT
VSYDPQRHTGRLRRLDAAHYRGRSYVHWSMTVDQRATDWLDALHHARLREWLAHALGRHALVCPAYCAMPDHAHFLWVGWSDASDQRKAAALLRAAWNRELRCRGCALQRQAHDHVLREEERERGAFTAVAAYVFENPVRAGLVEQWRDYPFLGALVPGYPELDPRAEDFWERFWRIYAGLAEKRWESGGETLARSATTESG